MTDQPPLGLRPSWVVHEHRLEEIASAILRYREAKTEIPNEWLRELESLCRNLLTHRGRREGEMRT